MSEFGGTRKDETTQHALVGLASAALAADVFLPSQVRRPQFPQRDNKVLKKKKKNYKRNKKNKKRRFSVGLATYCDPRKVPFKP